MTVSQLTSNLYLVTWPIHTSFGKIVHVQQPCSIQKHLPTLSYQMRSEQMFGWETTLSDFCKVTGNAELTVGEA